MLLAIAVTSNILSYLQNQMTASLLQVLPDLRCHQSMQKLLKNKTRHYLRHENVLKDEQIIYLPEENQISRRYHHQM